MPDEKTALPESVPDHVVERLLGKDWTDLEVLEEAGYLLFPEKIYKRKKDGSFESKDILLRVPREHELRKARVMARQIAQEDGLDLDRDEDLISNIEDTCILTFAIRENIKGFPPLWPEPKQLEKTYDKASLIHLWAKLDNLTKVVNPAPETISENEILVVVSKIASERSIAPLLVYGSEAQNSCIVTMADLLVNSLEPRS